MLRPRQYAAQIVIERDRGKRSEMLAQVPEICRGWVSEYVTYYFQMRAARIRAARKSAGK